jgi:DNA primase
VKPSAERASFLLEASKTFRDQFEGSPAEEYLEQHRGISPETSKSFGLGYVGDSVPSGFEMYRGRLAVPYLRYGPLGELSVASIRFRCTKTGCVKDENGEFLEKEVHLGNHGKMESMAGDSQQIYNTSDLAKYHDEIAVCEGEPDTWTTKECGIPVIGIQGVTGWKDHFTELFEGYRVVWVLADGDDPGMKFAESVAAKLPVARIVPMDPGMDVNKSVRKYGSEYLLEKVGFNG